MVRHPCQAGALICNLACHWEHDGAPRRAAYAEGSASAVLAAMGRPAGDARHCPVAAPEKEALCLYRKRLEAAKEASPGELLCFGRLDIPVRGERKVADDSRTYGDRNDLVAELERDIAQQHLTCPEMNRAPALLDSEGRLLCQQCQLPLGDFAYSGQGGQSSLLHGECLAQCVLHELKLDEDEAKKAEVELKRRRRAEYSVGWTPSVIPANAASANKLGCAVLPRGLCCLVIEPDHSVRIAPTVEPAAAVNLEYLAVALQVRRSEGREPLFSLDPVESEAGDGQPDIAMQVKRFEPEWLAATSVGEVMFQADYHLKELSFGEYEQPVIGMRSCFDLSEKDDEEAEWSAREWFVVKKAEIQLSDDQVVIPQFKMGVEAREQVLGNYGLEDAPITRPDHPLVKYAEAFTHNFDLIAERKSVVAQLREVAKASIVAKFLLEAGMVLEDSWFRLASHNTPACCLEVPQLWNDRFSSKICVKDGAIENFRAPRGHGLYGGVDFGIDRFRLSAPSRVATSVFGGRPVPGRPASLLMATSRTSLTMGPARQFARLSAPLGASMSMAASRAGLGVPRAAASLSMAAPQGVDLCLDHFNLSAAAPRGQSRWAAAVCTEDAQLALGSAFWPDLAAGSESMLGAEDRSLFEHIFNPHMSDRREEGERFVPPATGSAYLQKLRHLVRAEQFVCRRREEHFLSTGFVAEDAGPLFPSSWRSSFAVAREGTGGKAVGAPLPSRRLLARPEYKAAHGGMLRKALKTATASFDKRTEDGARFRVYRLGSLELRTVQDHEGEEEVGMAYSVCGTRPADSLGQYCWGADDQDRIVKVVQYVEGAQVSRFQYYIVLETEKGDTITLQKPDVGHSMWTENPEHLEGRNVVAKVIRSSECSAVGTTVGDMRSFQAQGVLKHLTCMQYVQAIYERALGGNGIC